MSGGGEKKVLHNKYVKKKKKRGLQGVASRERNDTRCLEDTRI